MRFLLLLAVLAPWSVWSLPSGLGGWLKVSEDGTTHPPSPTTDALTLPQRSAGPLPQEEEVDQAGDLKDEGLLNRLKVIHTEEEEPESPRETTSLLRGDVMPEEVKPSIDDVSTSEQPRNVTTDDTTDVRPTEYISVEKSSSAPAVSNRDATPDDAESEKRTDDVEVTHLQPHTNFVNVDPTPVVSDSTEGEAHPESHCSKKHEHTPLPPHTGGASRKTHGDLHTGRRPHRPPAGSKHQMRSLSAHEHPRLPKEASARQLPELNDPGQPWQHIPKAVKALQHNPWLHCRLLDLIQAAASHLRGDIGMMSPLPFRDIHKSKSPRSDEVRHDNHLPEYAFNNMKDSLLGFFDKLGLLHFELFLNNVKSSTGHPTSFAQKGLHSVGMSKEEDHPSKSMERGRRQEKDNHAPSRPVSFGVPFLRPTMAKGLVGGSQSMAVGPDSPDRADEGYTRAENPSAPGDVGSETGTGEEQQAMEDLWPDGSWKI